MKGSNENQEGSNETLEEWSDSWEIWLNGEVLTRSLQEKVKPSLITYFLGENATKMKGHSYMKLIDDFAII